MQECLDLPVLMIRSMPLFVFPVLVLVINIDGLQMSDRTFTLCAYFHHCGKLRRKLAHNETDFSLLWDACSFSLFRSSFLRGRPRSVHGNQCSENRHIGVQGEHRACAKILQGCVPTFGCTGRRCSYHMPTDALALCEYGILKAA